MISTRELTKFVQDIEKARRDTPKALKRFQESIAGAYFAALQANAPPDDEGRLRASFERRSAGHGKEWVEKYNQDGVEVGTKVYYAPMVNDGHVIGARIGNKGHRKTSASDRKAAADAAKRGWVSGRFFREAAEGQVDAEIPSLADDFTDDALREVM